jgi:hypothetical protein
VSAQESFCFPTLPHHPAGRRPCRRDNGQTCRTRLSVNKSIEATTPHGPATWLASCVLGVARLTPSPPRRFEGCDVTRAGVYKTSTTMRPGFTRVVHRVAIYEFSDINQTTLRPAATCTTSAPPAARPMLLTDAGRGSECGSIPGRALAAVFGLPWTRSPVTPLGCHATATPNEQAPRLERPRRFDSCHKHG